MKLKNQQKIGQKTYLEKIQTSRKISIRFKHPQKAGKLLSGAKNNQGGYHNDRQHKHLQSQRPEKLRC
jgi:hypothetical protein